MYKLKESNENIQGILRDFDEIGLIGILNEKRGKFFITQLLQSF